jgi:Cysteine-rich CPXCG
LATGVLAAAETLIDCVRMNRLPTSKQIDALYGLEPVFEPSELIDEAAGNNLLEQYVGVGCPYCAETITVHLDLSVGSQTYIEDCQVCCQAIQFSVQVADEAGLEALSATRIDL